jgi:anti-sigma factor RsiW
MKCAGAAPLLGSLPGELDPTDEALLSAHLSTCESCRARLADQEALARVVEDGLLLEAARRDFTGFADGVMARIPASAWRGVEPTGWLEQVRAFLRRHRVLAATSALVPALAAVALYLYIGRTIGPGPSELAVEVTSEDLAAVVLETSDGPVILVGEASDGT